MDGVAQLWLVERGLGGDVAEPVPTVAEPVRPRRQHLAAAAVRPLVGSEAVDHVDPAGPIGPDRRADLGDDELLRPVTEHPLLARGRCRGRGGHGAPVSYRRVRILVTNDDGVHAPGLAAVTRALAGWRAAAPDDEVRDVVVVAPLTNHSGASAAVGTVYEREAIAYRAVPIDGADDVPVYGLDASPALSVIVGVLGGFGPRPDLVVSGINLGVNVGRSVLHSGTVGAALTAAQLGLSGLAVSLRSGSVPDHWETAAGARRRPAADARGGAAADRAQPERPLRVAGRAPRRPSRSDQHGRDHQVRRWSARRRPRVVPGGAAIPKRARSGSPSAPRSPRSAASKARTPRTMPPSSPPASRH